MLTWDQQLSNGVVFFLLESTVFLTEMKWKNKNKKQKQKLNNSIIIATNTKGPTKSNISVRQSSF